MIQSHEVRDLPILVVLEKLGFASKTDSFFTPVKSAKTQRIHVSNPNSGYVFELIVTGQKWFDVKSGKGGGGAIDLVMYLNQVNFSAAIAQLASLLSASTALKD